MDVPGRQPAEELAVGEMRPLTGVSTPSFVGLTRRLPPELQALVMLQANTGTTIIPFCNSR